MAAAPERDILQLLQQHMICHFALLKSARLRLSAMASRILSLNSKSTVTSIMILGVTTHPSYVSIFYDQWVASYTSEEVQFYVPAQTS
jgi:hypothetical protein